MDNIFFVGDIHTRPELVTEALRISDGGQVIFLGDIFDGPNGAQGAKECLDLIRASGAEMVLGNHELYPIFFGESQEKLAGAWGLHYDLTEQDQARIWQEWCELRALLTEDDMEWLKSRPLWVKGGHGDKRWVAVHAQLPKGRLPARFVNGTPTLAQMELTDNTCAENFWAESYQGRHGLAFVGHTRRSKLNGKCQWANVELLDWDAKKGGTAAIAKISDKGVNVKPIISSSNKNEGTIMNFVNIMKRIFLAMILFFISSAAVGCYAEEPVPAGMGTITAAYNGTCSGFRWQGKVFTAAHCGYQSTDWQDNSFAVVHQKEATWNIPEDLVDIGLECSPDLRWWGATTSRTVALEDLTFYEVKRGRNVWDLGKEVAPWTPGAQACFRQSFWWGRNRFQDGDSGGPLLAGDEPIGNVSWSSSMPFGMACFGRLETQPMWGEYVPTSSSKEGKGFRMKLVTTDSLAVTQVLADLAIAGAILALAFVMAQIRAKFRTTTNVGTDADKNLGNQGKGLMTRVSLAESARKMGNVILVILLGVCLIAAPGAAPLVAPSSVTVHKTEADLNAALAAKEAADKASRKRVKRFVKGLMMAVAKHWTNRRLVRWMAANGYKLPMKPVVKAKKTEAANSPVLAVIAGLGLATGMVAVAVIALAAIAFFAIRKNRAEDCKEETVDADWGDLLEAPAEPQPQSLLIRLTELLGQEPPVQEFVACEPAPAPIAAPTEPEPQPLLMRLIELLPAQQQEPQPEPEIETIEIAEPVAEIPVIDQPISVKEDKPLSKKEQDRKVIEEISGKFPKFSASNLMSVRKRLIAIHEAKMDLYRLRHFGVARRVRTSKGKYVNVKTMNSAAFNKFASILLKNKEMATWFGQASHDPSWEAFWVTIEQLAKKPKVLETWSAAEWMVARNRYTQTVELVNQLSIRFLGKIMNEVKVKTVEVTSLRNKETYYFRYVSPQQALEECKDINARYFAPDDPGSYCVGKGHYQMEMASGAFHGYIVDKTVDARTNTYKDGEKFSFGFVLVSSVGVTDWGFGDQNRHDGHEEELAKAVFGNTGESCLESNKPEETWIRMILEYWVDMRKTSYNEWVKKIEEIVKSQCLRHLTNVHDNRVTFKEFTGKNGKLYYETHYGKSLDCRVFPSKRGATRTGYYSKWAAGTDNFVQKNKVSSEKHFQFFLQAANDPHQARFKAKLVGPLLDTYVQNTPKWGLSEDQIQSAYEFVDLSPSMAEFVGMNFKEFSDAYSAAQADKAVFSLKTKEIMTMKEVKAQIQRFYELDMNYTCFAIARGGKGNSSSVSKSSVTPFSDENRIGIRLYQRYGYRWMKTKSGYMLVSPEVAAQNAHRMMTEEQVSALDIQLRGKRMHLGSEHRGGFVIINQVEVEEDYLLAETMEKEHQEFIRQQEQEYDLDLEAENLRVQFALDNDDYVFSPIGATLAAVAMLSGLPGWMALLPIAITALMAFAKMRNPNPVTVPCSEWRLYSGIPQATNAHNQEVKMSNSPEVVMTYRQHAQAMGIVSVYSSMEGCEGLDDCPIYKIGTEVDGLVPVFPVSDELAVYATTELMEKILQVQYNSATPEKAGKYARSMAAARYKETVDLKKSETVDFGKLGKDFAKIFDGIHYMDNGVAISEWAIDSAVRRVVAAALYVKGTISMVNWLPPGIKLAYGENKADLDVATGVADGKAVLFQPGTDTMKTKPGLLLGVQIFAAMLSMRINDPRLIRLLKEYSDINLSEWEKMKESVFKGAEDEVHGEIQGHMVEDRIAELMVRLGVHPGTIPTKVKSLVNRLMEDIDGGKLRMLASHGFTTYVRPMEFVLMAKLWEHQVKAGKVNENLGRYKLVKKAAEFQTRHDKRCDLLLKKYGIAFIYMPKKLAEKMGIPEADIFARGFDPRKNPANLGEFFRAPTSGLINIQVFYLPMPDEMFADSNCRYPATLAHMNATLVAADGGDVDDNTLNAVGPLAALMRESINERNAVIEAHSDAAKAHVAECHAWLKALPSRIDTLARIPNIAQMLEGYFDIEGYEHPRTGKLIPTSIREKAAPRQFDFRAMDPLSRWQRIHFQEGNPFHAIVGGMANAQMFGAFLLGGNVMLPAVVATSPKVIGTALVQGEISLAVDAANSGKDWDKAWETWHDIDAVLTVLGLAWALKAANEPVKDKKVMATIPAARRRMGPSLMALASFPYNIVYDGNRKSTIPGLEDVRIKIVDGDKRLTLQKRLDIVNDLTELFREYYKNVIGKLQGFIASGVESNTGPEMVIVAIESFLAERPAALRKLIDAKFPNLDAERAEGLTTSTFAAEMYRRFFVAKTYLQPDGRQMTLKMAMETRFDQIDELANTLPSYVLEKLRNTYAIEPQRAALKARHEYLWPMFEEVYGSEAKSKYELYLLGECCAILSTSSESVISMTSNGKKLPDDLDEINPEHQLDIKGGIRRAAFRISTAAYEGYADIAERFLSWQVKENSSKKILQNGKATTAAFLVRKSKDKLNPTDLIGKTIEEILSLPNIQLAYGGKSGVENQDPRAAALAVHAFQRETERKIKLTEEGKIRGASHWAIISMMGYAGVAKAIFYGSTVSASDVVSLTTTKKSGEPYTRDIIWLTFTEPSPVTPPTKEEETPESLLENLENLDVDAMLARLREQTDNEYSGDDTEDTDIPESAEATPIEVVLPPVQAEAKKPFVIAGTGSRNLRLDNNKFNLVKAKLTELLSAAKEKHGDNLLVLSGMAEGFDEALAEAAMAANVKLQAAIPNRSFGQYYWRDNSQTKANRYAKFVELCQYAKKTGGIVYVCGCNQEATGCNHIKTSDGQYMTMYRNLWMVDRATRVWVYNPVTSGTKHCYEYAKKVGVPTFEIKV